MKEYKTKPILLLMCPKCNREYQAIALLHGLSDDSLEDVQKACVAGHEVKISDAKTYIPSWCDCD